MNVLLLKNLNAIYIRNAFTGLLSTNSNKRNVSDKSASTPEPSVTTTKLATTRPAEDVKQYLKLNSIKNYDGWNSLLLNDYCKDHVAQGCDPSLFVDQMTGKFAVNFLLSIRTG